MLGMEGLVLCSPSVWGEGGFLLLRARSGSVDRGGEGTVICHQSVICSLSHFLRTCMKTKNKHQWFNT